MQIPAQGPFRTLAPEGTLETVTLLCWNRTSNRKLKWTDLISVDVWTYYVHEGQQIFLDMLPAVEEMNGIIHSQQDLEEGVPG